MVQPIKYLTRLKTEMPAGWHGDTMKIQIKNVSPHQTSKVLSLMFALLTLPFAIIGILSFIFSPDTGGAGKFPFLFFAFAPIFYGLFAYVFNRLFCFFYNFIAKNVGGIEFVAEEQDIT